MEPGNIFFDANVARTRGRLRAMLDNPPRAPPNSIRGSQMGAMNNNRAVSLPILGHQPDISQGQFEGIWMHNSASGPRETSGLFETRSNSHATSRASPFSSVSSHRTNNLSENIYNLGGLQPTPLTMSGVKTEIENLTRKLDQLKSEVNMSNRASVVSRPSAFMPINPESHTSGERPRINSVHASPHPHQNSQLVHKPVAHVPHHLYNEGVSKSADMAAVNALQPFTNPHKQNPAAFLRRFNDTVYGTSLTELDVIKALQRLVRTSDELWDESLDLAHNSLEEYEQAFLTAFFSEDAQEATHAEFMSSGNHIGKVMLKIRDEEPIRNVIPEKLMVRASPRYWCHPKKSYIVCGGLGGVGLELTDWLVLRGARNIVLSSRNGLTDGYQASRISLWKSYGANIFISIGDIAIEENARQLIVDANIMAPVSAIFNLAGVIQDKLFAEQTEEMFASCQGSKVAGTMFLDKFSREMCPYLEHFVVFSSVSSGLGNFTQSNYGIANSTAERICEARQNDGLPGLAIQWGPIADIGMVANTMKIDANVVLDGVAQEDIRSCLSSLDYLLFQSDSVILNIVVAEKRISKKKNQSLTDAIARVLGYENAKKVNKNLTLIELGSDSIMGLEINNILQKDFEIFLPPEEIKNLTFTKLEKIEADLSKKEFNEEASTIITETFTSFFLEVSKFRETLERTIVQLPSLLPVEDSENDYPVAFILPGLEGIPHYVENLASRLKARVYCAVYNQSQSLRTVQDFAGSIFVDVDNFAAKFKNIYIIGISFGGMVALELLKLLEKKRKVNQLWLVESSPSLLKRITEICGEISDPTAKFLELIMQRIQQKETDFKNEEILDLEAGARSSFPEIERMDDFQKAYFVSLYSRVIAILQYESLVEEPLTTSTTLIRCEKTLSQMNADYDVSQYILNTVEVHAIPDCDHFTIINHVKTSELMNVT